MAQPDANPTYRGTERRQGERRRGWPVPFARTMDLAATIILPAYNESAALPRVLDSLVSLIDPSTTEVIVVDDGSTDGTSEVASRYPCRVVQHTRNYGKGAAVQTGVAHARGRFVIVMDADNTYPSSAVPAMIALSEQYEFVRCVRKEGRSNLPLVNRLGNKLFDSVLKVMHGLEGDDHLSGLYGLSREAFQAIDITANKFDLEIEIAIKARARGLKTTSLPVTYGARIGDKKLRAWGDGRSIMREIAIMALVYNPGLTFVLPGFLIWLAAGILAALLGQGTLITPYARLDVNSLLVAALGATLGFQFIIFGVAAALFGVELGVRPRKWLVAISKRRVRFIAGCTGLGLTIAGAWMLIGAIGGWIAHGGGDFNQTRTLVEAGMFLSLGVQTVVGTVFVSIFAGRMGRRENAVVPREFAEIVAPLRDLGETGPV